MCAIALCYICPTSNGKVAVIDPGPADEHHLKAIAAATRGERLTHILITHSHHDHCDGARALQALLGIILVLLGQKPGTGTGLYYLHYVYGAIVVLAIPIAITYATGGKNQRRDILIYSIAALVLVAAALRALTTGLQ